MGPASGWRWLAAYFVLPVFTANLFANPQGMTVVGGNATATAKGPNLDIRTTSRNTFLNWQSFNIAAGETTTFRQPSATSIVWNRINDPNPSQIFGRLNANGIVVLMNQSGFYFGPGSVVNAAGFVATTATSLPEFRIDNAWQFSGPPPAASIINYGEIKTKNGGSAFLIAEKVENHGILTAPDGTLGLYAGKEVLMSERPDGRGLSVSVKLPSGCVDNRGTLIADAGSVLLHAQNVNQNGLIQANSVRKRNGVVELIASDSIELGPQSVIEARGKTDVSSGGQITIKADDTFSDKAGSRISIAGGSRGGNGGEVEISAPGMSGIATSVDGRAAAGFRGGSLLIDPTDIVISSTGVGDVVAGQVNYNDPPTTLQLNINSSFTGLGQIVLQATHNITLSAGTSWDLARSTGVSAPGSLLSLEAGNDIIIQNIAASGGPSSIIAGPGWSVSLAAGRDFTSVGAFKTAVGNITFQNATSLSAQDGQVSIRAGNAVSFQNGSSFSAQNSQVSLRAGGAVTLGPNVTWNLGSGLNSPGSVLSVQSAGDITLQGGSQGSARITAGPGWSLALSAGVDLNTGNMKQGVGNLAFQTGASLTAQDGTTTLRAGNAITLGPNASWTLGQGFNSPGSSFSAQSGGDMTIQGGTQGSARITAGAGWSLALTAGADFSSGNMRQGAGNLTFQANTSLTAQDGATTLRAGNGITVASGSTWNLGIGNASAPAASQLSLEAGGDVNFQTTTTTRVTAGPSWSVLISAGRNYTTAQDVTAGAGSILFSGTQLEAQDGTIHLLAGNNVTVGSGSVRTMGGGSIDVTAVSGSVNTGTRNNGFTFLPTADLSANTHMTVDPSLGGISTGKGGNLSISAGLDIISLLPQGQINGSPTDAGSGAFGLAPGNVTLRAGRDVMGHYVLRNGVGTISAGNDAGHIGGTALALSLSAGHWDVRAGHDVGLQEVRNPNGIYNFFSQSGQGKSPAQHYFEYAPDAAVSLNAGNAVQLLGSNLPRRAGQESSFPALYAPSLFVSAGAGGILLRNDIPLTLFPSPIGQLELTTTGGGSFRGVSPTAGASDTGSGLATIQMSDSAASQWTSTTSFGLFDRAPVPLHLNDPNPIRANISGNMNNVLLISPKSIDLNIAGNMSNSRLNIQNLHPTDVSRLNVGGDIINQNEFSIVPLATAPDLTLLERAYPVLPPELAGLAGKLHYDNGSLIFRGHMTDAELQALEHIQVQALDPKFNTPLFDKDGNPVLVTVSVLDSGTAQSLFDLSQKVPSNPDTGYLVGGPGALSINARNMDLGATLGIRSLGPLNNPTLARLGYLGASISVTLDGDLDMFSTTISSVAGGDVEVFAKGNMSVGSSIFTGDQLARGIYTVAKSDVTVIAGGNINVNGSRIAAYDGGNIMVASLTGNVDAGHGGQGAAQVEKVVVDPVTGEVKTYTPTIPGSGILATTFPHPLDKNFPDSVNTVGNITVLTPHGDINAAAGGIVQAALNGVKSPDAKLTLSAGSTDESGKVTYVGNVDASGSGVIGANVRIKATGSIKGLVVSQGDITLGANQNISVTAIGVGNVSVAAGGTVSGTIVGVGGLAASGSSIEAALLSQNVTTSGNLAGAQVGFAQANAAGSTSQSALSGDQETKKTIVTSTEETTDDAKKKRGNTPAVARRVGRVTVILPKS